MIRVRTGMVIWGMLFAAVGHDSLRGQTASSSGVPATSPLASCLIVPHARSGVWQPGAATAVQIERVDAAVQILDQVAVTTLDIVLKNPASQAVQAELLVPVPNSAVVRGFSFSGSAKEPTAKLLPRDEAVKTYHAIVSKLRDPALLEFAAQSAVRSSVFPVPANGTLTVRLTYDAVLDADGGRVDYVLPRTESLDYHVPWNVSVAIRSTRGVATVYSPSHPVAIEKRDTNEVKLKLAGLGTLDPGPIRISYLVAKGDVTASLYAYPDPKLDGGYFLMLAGLPVDAAKVADAAAVKRDVTLVLDRSGSMAGEKFEQARQAARQIINSLAPGEAFNIIAYDDAVQPLAEESLIKSAETTAAAEAYLQRLATGAGTNIHDALVEALRRKPREGMLPLVLFLTDGLPTVGNTSEAAIREVATKANPFSRRLFTFGVGFDVNTPLLERLATDTRGSATFVLPKENVEVKVAGVFKQLSGPLLSDPKLVQVAPAAAPAGALPRVSELLPGRLPDVFEGDQLVILGRYHGTEPLEFSLSGNYRGKPREFQFKFDLKTATTKNAFVPRLWASRKIAVLVDAIRDLGADKPKVASFASSKAVPATGADDPRMKELVESIVKLSKEFGVLTEYTAFLAEEGTDLSKLAQVQTTATDNFRRRAIGTRSGISSVNQSLNSGFMRDQACGNAGNWHYNADNQRVSIATVQQIHDGTYFRRGNTWIDARLIDRAKEVKPARTVEVGSEELKAIVEKLAKTERSGVVALKGDVLLEIDGEIVLIKAPTAAK